MVSVFSIAQVCCDHSCCDGYCCLTQTSFISADDDSGCVDLCLLLNDSYLNGHDVKLEGGSGGVTYMRQGSQLDI